MSPLLPRVFLCCFLHGCWLLLANTTDLHTDGVDVVVVVGGGGEKEEERSGGGGGGAGS